jgi:hypothetical protein
MSLFDPIWVALNRQGCHMHRDTEQSLARAGFVLDTVFPFQIFAPGMPAFPMRRIESHFVHPLEETTNRKAGRREDEREG